MTVEQVREFHRGCGTPDPNEPRVPAAERLALRERLIQEEADEVFDAMRTLLAARPGGARTSAMRALAKEIADLRYVIDGTVLALGIGDEIDEVCRRVHESNMSKFDPVTGMALRREDGKILKGPNYAPPDLSDLFRGFIGKDD